MKKPDPEPCLYGCGGTMNPADQEWEFPTGYVWIATCDRCQNTRVVRKRFKLAPWARLRLLLVALRGRAA